MGSIKATMTAFRLTTTQWLVLDVLAVYRLTILVTQDIITEPFRKWVHRHLGDYWFDFITCPYCVSIWIAGAVVLLTVLAPNQWKYAAYLLTCSAVASYLSDRR